MKTQLLLLFTAIVLISCTNDQAQDNAPIATPKNNETGASTSADPQSGEGIAGSWKLSIEAYDENSNKVLDEAERKKGIKNKYSFRFNADGTCKIQEVYSGRYEVKTEGGNKILYVYRNAIKGEEEEAPVPDVYLITSMGKKELVLLDKAGDLTFWVFERAS